MIKRLRLATGVFNAFLYNIHCIHNLSPIPPVCLYVYNARTTGKKKYTHARNVPRQQKKYLLKTYFTETKTIRSDYIFV